MEEVIIKRKNCKMEKKEKQKKREIMKQVIIKEKLVFQDLSKLKPDGRRSS